MRSSRPRRPRSSLAEPPVDPYDGFADDYHWLYDDRATRFGSDTPGVRATLAGLDPGSRILDAACGIGIEAVALARQGFVVTAADANAKMLAKTRERIRDAKVDVDVRQSIWAQLPERLGGDVFDAVLCVGNSISHAGNESEMVAAFEGFRAVLAPEGVIILDVHDWEMIRSLGDRVLKDPVVVERGGLRCTRSYTWRIPEGLDAPAVLEIALTITGDDGVTVRTHTIPQHPVSRSQLTDRLRSAALRLSSMDVDPTDDRYTVVASARWSAALDADLAERDVG